MRLRASKALLASLAVVFALVTTWSSLAHSQEVRLRLATTTSTENTGLLNVLLPPFEQKNNCKVDVISVGTGKALKLGERGDADVVLVHARKAEDKFVADGFGVDRRDVMHNDFVILGPENDPAGAKGDKDPADVFKKIAEKGSPFISRGDESGTHVKEKEMWEAAGVAQKGPWYMESGQDMGATLVMANEKLAYTLCDRATWLAFKDKSPLKIISEGDPRLYNPYGVIAVNPQKNPHVKYDLAKAFIEYITSEEGQKIIGDFKKNGELLFFPDAIKTPGAPNK
jgi:tungstate transport system substrate-binding protein